jgi:hypothetical protein
MAAPKLVDAATTEDVEVVVFLSDLHVPYEDKKAVRAVIDLIEDLQPHRIVLNGDIQDFYRVSRFDKDWERTDTLQDEIDTGNFYRMKFRDAAPNAVIDETEGNHEARLGIYLDRNADALGSLRSLRLPALLQHKTYQITGHGDEGFLLRPDFWIKHGEIARQDAGMSAKAQMLKAFTNGLTGHTHRLGEFTVRVGMGKVYRWFENGCLCNIDDADYIRGGAPNWMQGFSVGQFSTNSDKFKVELVEVEDGGFSYHGKTYGQVAVGA